MVNPSEQPESARGEMGVLWLDRPDAEQEAVSRGTRYPSHYPGMAREMINEGFTILKGAIEPGLCDAVVDDYQRYLKRNKKYADQYIDVKGRHNRLVNFHMSSENAMKIGCHNEIMRVLDYLFGYKAGIYTSLTFEYGTEQPIHRDAPFFHTFPVNYFVGAWCALEDIEPDAGPLMYVPGGHRFPCDQHAIYRRIRTENPEQPDEWVVRHALEAYYGEVIARSGGIGNTKQAVLQKGDVAIWHPQLPHGGAPAINPQKTRRSVVFHCAPETLQVYQHDVFFQYEDPGFPPPRYAFGSYQGRSYALAGETAFQ
ncbi:phytanoyl-CoA dioxygenase family protein [Nitrospira sp. T9]|uniref:phytanoyl-CoA dioxygenase family protein n=1 Tax=unclassified Nitrospira TaxID=2652172 RepID=UPI003F9DBBC5